MAFDYKKEYQEFYLPPRKPGIVCVPEMCFAAVRGHGDPNEEGGDYQRALSMLYAVSYTLKMSKMGAHRIEGYFDYVVPPLEGLWWQDGAATIDLSRKKELSWVAMIRLPEFAGEEALGWARAEAERKKSIDCARVEFFPYMEGDCVQCMHIGPYDNEPETVQMMDHFAKEQGYVLDFTSGRYHHEIYLSDVRLCKPENLKTVIRHPIRCR